MKNAAKKIIIIVILAIFLGVYYYITLPAINIHSGGFWQCLLFLAAFITVMYLLVKSGQTGSAAKPTVNKASGWGPGICSASLSWPKSAWLCLF